MSLRARGRVSGSLRRQRQLPAAFAFLLLLSVLRVCAGQGGATPAPEGQVPTLHLFTNLIQVPTLVLSAGRQDVPPIAQDRFLLSLDSGPTFHPTYVRREGDDPIALAVLIDLSGHGADLAPHLGQALMATAERLQAHDSVSFYVLDCALVRSATAIPPEPCED